jgi:hypothetical protein
MDFDIKKERKVRKEIQDNLNQGIGLLYIQIHGVKGLGDKIQDETKEELYEILSTLEDTIQLESREEYVLYLWCKDKRVPDVLKDLYYPNNYPIKELKGKKLSNGATIGYIKPNTKLKKVEPIITPYILAIEGSGY